MPENDLSTILEDRKSEPDQLIEVLQEVQAMFGYLSRESMEIVADTLGVPVIEVFRVASFYKAFRLHRCGKHVLTICDGTACHVRGAPMLIDQATNQTGSKLSEVSDDGFFSVEHVNCVGACALGPIVSHNGEYHRHMTPAKLRVLIKSVRNMENGGKTHDAVD